MIFTNDKAIYIQMADRLCDEILSGVYKDRALRSEYKYGSEGLRTVGP